MLPEKRILIHKLRAAAASFAVFLAFTGLLTFLTWHEWFPDYLFWTDGGLQGLRLVVSVDFVLGPLLALVFFHPEKTRGKLLFDIVVIAVVQISAMVWGAHQVYSQRPLVVVFGDHRFISVAPGILAEQRKKAADMKRFSPDSPPYAYRRDPASAAEEEKRTVLLMRYGIHFEAQAWLFEPFLANLDHVFERQQGAHQYIASHLVSEWQQWVSGRPATRMEDYRFALYEGRYHNALLIFSPAGVYQGYLRLSEGVLPEFAGVPPSVKEAH
jgi:hypothetical protein